MNLPSELDPIMDLLFSDEQDFIERFKESVLEEDYQSFSVCDYLIHLLYECHEIGVAVTIDGRAFSDIAYAVSLLEDLKHADTVNIDWEALSEFKPKDEDEYQKIFDHIQTALKNQSYSFINIDDGSSDYHFMLIENSKLNTLKQLLQPFHEQLTIIEYRSNLPFKKKATKKKKPKLTRKEPDHMQSLLNDAYARIDQYIAWIDDPVKDWDGDSTSSVSGFYRDMAVYEYLLNHDIDKFRHYLHKNILYNFYLLEKYDAGHKIASYYVNYSGLMQGGSSSNLNYALILGIPDLIYKAAQAVGARSRDKTPPNKPYYLAHVFAELALGRIKGASEYLEKAYIDIKKNRLQKIITESRVKVFEIILNIKKYPVEELLDSFYRVQKENVKSKHMIWDATVYEDLNLEAIALVNLMRLYGLTIDIDDAMVPADLLIDLDIRPHAHLIQH